MSHCLIVTAPSSCQRELVFQRGLRIFELAHKLFPIDKVHTADTSLALLPCLLSPTPLPVRSPTAYVCGVGTWFYQGATGVEALRRIAADTLSFRNPLDKFLCDMDGWFAVAGLDINGEVTIVTDRLGEFHVYATHTDDCRVISTSSLVLGALSDATWDPIGCRQFLETGVIFEPSRTLLKNVKKLEPGSLYTFANGRIRSRKYWSMRSALEERSDSPGNVLELALALRNTVCTIIKNFEHPVFDLTGGFDTRGILGAVLQSGACPDFVVNGPDSDIDVAISTRIARECRLKHHHFWSGFQSAAQWWDRAKQSLVLVDGEQDVLYYAPIMEVHTQLAQSFDATVNGNVGEICQGHWWELCAPFFGSRAGLDAGKIASRRLAAEGEIPGLLAFEFPSSLVEYFAEVVRQQQANLGGYPNVVHMDNIYLSFWEQRFYGRTVSATCHLWPVISPYNFGRILETALSVPWENRIWRRLCRTLISHQSAKLAALPIADGGPAGPLRFSNALNFLPLAREYKSLVSRRFAKQFHLKTNANTLAETRTSVDLLLEQLTQLDEVRDLTDPRTMVTSPLYHPPQLRQTLNKRPCRPHSPTAWPGRVLTLELLGRQLRDCRAKLCTCAQLQSN